ncbi:MAG: DUF2007 domain-containing protein [Anaerolineales bacterium]
MQQNIMKVASVSGNFEAELLRSLFDAHGIQVWLSQEAVGSVIPLTVGPMAQVDLMVLEDQFEKALEVLSDYNAAKPESED